MVKRMVFDSLGILFVGALMLASTLMFLTVLDEYAARSELMGSLTLYLDEER